MEKVKVDSSFNHSFFGVVTSMCLDDNKLYIGKGNFLLIYDTESDKKINYLQAFNSNKITKIKIFPINENTKIIITIGETQVKYSLLNKNENQYHFKMIKTMSGDYVVDTMIIQKNNNYFLSLGFINNYFELYSLKINDDKNITFEYINTFFSPSKCIVYSMAFYYNYQNNSILIASGTVFRQIIVWEVSLDSITQLATNLVLTGHEGVIFSVHFINESKLTSTSDDRTTKVWTIDIEKKSFSQITLFGHSCRVWDSIVNIKKNILVSISEDATGRVYDIEKNEFLYELSNGHLGKNIRSVEINDNYIWTGGEDGQIIKWSLNHQKEKKIEQKKNNILNCSLSNTDEQSKKAKIKQKNFTPCVKVLKFINENMLLIGSNNGKVASYNIKEKKQDKDYLNDDQVRVINSIEVVLNKFILVGLSDGNIQLINMEKPQEENITIKIFHNIRIPFISHKIFSESIEMFLFISTALGRTKIYYFDNIKDITFTSFKEKLINENKDYLELYTGARYAVGISSCEIVKTKHPKYYIVLLGDYDGRLYFSQIKKISNCLYNFNNNIKYLQIHSNDKITKLLFSTNQNILYSISRDGKMKKFFITNELNSSFSIKEINSKNRSDINSFENILFSKIDNFENGEYIIVGHHGRNLLLYNAMSNLIFHTNDVKGVNRPLDSVLTSTNSITYAFSQAEQVSIVNVPLNSNDSETIANNGFLQSYTNPIHGRVIHNINIMEVDSNKGLFLCITASEDTKINFYLFNKDTVFEKNEMKYIGQFTKHECAIRKTRIVRSVIKENIVKEVVFLSIASKCEAFLFKIILNTEKEIGDIVLLNDFTPKKDSEQIENTRNMDACIYQANDLYTIYITNTVSVTNIFQIKFNDNDHDISIVSASSIKNTKTNFIALSINYFIWNDNVILVYGQTNGNLNILNTKDNSDYYYKLHEAGINDIKILKNDKSYILFTCGEDCSVCVSEIVIDEKGKIDLKVLTVNREVHYSAIKSLYAKSSDGHIRVITGSYDQSVNVLDYNIEKNTLKRIEKIKCCVSEINSVSASLENDIACAAGQGIEIYKLKHI